MIKKINETIQFLQKNGFNKPEIGIVLGTGLGQLINEIKISKKISYKDIPNFETTTIESHKGNLIYGELSGKKVVVMQGRFHLYEGYSLQQVTYPIRILKKLGIHTLLISNAAGAINGNFKKGNLLLIDDHINLQGSSPLAFKGVEQLGERFTDMSKPYNPTLNKLLKNIAKETKTTLYEGVYAGVFGPQLETRAEYRMLKIIGADAVGMSTVPEVIVANHLQLKTAAIAVLTDQCDFKNLKPINISEIMKMAAKAEPKLILLFKTLLKNI